MNSILVLFAHPAIEKSRVGRAWAEAAQKLPQVTFHDLYEAYPEFDVDVKREQALLEEHELIVLQHPFYWYSTPAIMKQWFDLVLQHGWAYGSGGTALAGKKLLSAVTTGSGEEAYRSGEFHDTTVKDLLAPIRQTARLCGMEYLEPHVGYGALQMTSSQINLSAEDYVRVLRALCASDDERGPV